MKVASVWNRRNKILLRELVVTDFKLRYQGSVLGYLWSILKPIFLFIILYIVFDKFLRLGRDIEHFPVYLLVGIVLWNFFTEATVQGLQSIVSRGDLIRKINFPKFIIGRTRNGEDSELHDRPPQARTRRLRKGGVWRGAAVGAGSGCRTGGAHGDAKRPAPVRVARFRGR